MIRDIVEGNILDRRKMLDHVVFLQEQLHTKQKIVLTYVPDNDEGVEDKEKIQVQRLEFQEMFKEQAEQQEKKAEGMKKEAL